LQDMLNVLWHRCDQLPLLSDPDSAPRDWIPYLLYSMGNPFRFNLTELQQRRLIAVLAAIFKQTGTVKVIEDTLAFFLGLQFQVNPFITADWWSLGTSTLGIDAILGPSTEFARNAYEIIAPQTLTVEQRRIVVDIATTLDPLYMHLIRIVEPGDTPGTLTFWVLGESSLGFTTQLAP
jgi:phage tail-like protein